MSDLVGTPEDWFSRVAAHFSSKCIHVHVLPQNHLDAGCFNIFDMFSIHHC